MSDSVKKEVTVESPEIQQLLDEVLNRSETIKSEMNLAKSHFVIGCVGPQRLLLRRWDILLATLKKYRQISVIALEKDSKRVSKNQDKIATGTKIERNNKTLRIIKGKLQCTFQCHSLNVKNVENRQHKGIIGAVGENLSLPLKKKL